MALGAGEHGAGLPALSDQISELKVCNAISCLLFGSSIPGACARDLPPEAREQGWEGGLSPTLEMKGAGGRLGRTGGAGRGPELCVLGPCHLPRGPCCPCSELRLEATEWDPGGPMQKALEGVRAAPGRPRAGGCLGNLGPCY